MYIRLIKSLLIGGTISFIFLFILSYLLVDTVIIMGFASISTTIFCTFTILEKLHSSK